VLLVTDGKSHALGVQALARTGRRFSVALVGEDSLEANVGHLAALTGGEIFVSTGADLTQVFNTALFSLRAKHHPVSPIAGRPKRISVRRAGMTLTAEWQEAKGSMEGTEGEWRAVAALAASVALPALDTESAAQLAETEGLVTHLTSLVLVDEDGARQEGIPATRKVALPSPRLMADSLVRACRPAVHAEIDLHERIAPEYSLQSLQSRSRADLSILANKIDWDAAPLRRLQLGDLSALDRDVARAIQSAAALPEVVVLAKRLAIHPFALVIGLIARSESPRSRSAARLAKAILCDITHEGFDHIAQMLGLTG
jgi:hypothetical protein